MNFSDRHQPIKKSESAMKGHDRLGLDRIVFATRVYLLREPMLILLRVRKLQLGKRLPSCGSYPDAQM